MSSGKLFSCFLFKNNFFCIVSREISLTYCSSHCLSFKWDSWHILSVSVIDWSNYFGCTLFHHVILLGWLWNMPVEFQLQSSLMFLSSSCSALCQHVQLNNYFIIFMFVNVFLEDFSWTFILPVCLLLPLPVQLVCLFLMCSFFNIFFLITGTPVLILAKNVTCSVFNWFPWTL